MPGGDGTGPNGLGPMTGKGLGYCAGYRMPGGYINPIPGRGYFGRGCGCRRGRYRRFFVDKQENIQNVSNKVK